MSKARDISNLFSASTAAATDAEVTSAIATHASNTTNRHYKVGTTANRPESPNIGDLYFDTDLDRLIEYRSTGWKQVSEVPDAPTSVSATETGSTTASISFTAPTNVPVASYLVTSNPGNITASGSSSPISISGLTENTSYTFSVIAQGYNGNSQPTTSNSITTPTPVTVDYVVAAGGGGAAAGGSGAGGFKTSIGNSPIYLNTGTQYTITIGAGGVGASNSYGGDGTGQTQGSNSVFSIITATGGGRGGGSFTPEGSTSPSAYLSGGSGGGASYSSGQAQYGAGISGEGNNGGADNYNNPPYAAAGGGGAGSVGQSSQSDSVAGNGGIGVYNSLTNLAQAGELSSGNYYLAGGGGGGIYGLAGSGTAGVGGLGGGGNGSNGVSGTTAGQNGDQNTGGGAGGSSANAAGRQGGSGIVLIKSSAAASSTTGSPTYSNPSAGVHVYKFTASGSITF